MVENIALSRQELAIIFLSRKRYDKSSIIILVLARVPN